MEVQQVAAMEEKECHNQIVELNTKYIVIWSWHEDKYEYIVIKLW